MNKWELFLGLGRYSRLKLISSKLSYKSFAQPWMVTLMELSIDNSGYSGDLLVSEKREKLSLRLATVCWTVDNTNFNEVNSKNVLIGLLMIKCESWKENVFYKFKFRLVDPFLCIFISFLVLCLLFSCLWQKTIKNMILISKWHANHLFVGQNTQQLRPRVKEWRRRLNII